MSLSRRDLVGQAAAGAPTLAIFGALPASAADVDASRLGSSQSAWGELEHINQTMGPTRLTGSPEHQAFVSWIQNELGKALLQAGGQVFQEVFQNFPRWSAKSWSLHLGDKEVPTSSYFPYCTGGFTGARTALAPAPELAAPGGGGHYPLANRRSLRALHPSAQASGAVVDLGVFTGPDLIDWSKAAGKIALVTVSVNAVSGRLPPGSYTLDSSWIKGRPKAGPYVSRPAPSAVIFAPPDIANATKAGVKGVILVWGDISSGNAEGQYNPFTVPFSSWPPSSQHGSDPATTKPGIPALWVDAKVGADLANAAVSGETARLAVEAEFAQVPTATVWGILPGSRRGQDEEEILICNTHSDGPNIAEENGGVAVVQMARYFARIPVAQRRKTMVFMASTGHFGHRFLGSGRDWIVQHPQIMAKAVGCLTLEHLGCREWQDEGQGSDLTFAQTGAPLQSQIFVTAPNFQDRQPGPADHGLQQIVEGALMKSLDRAAVLSGGAFLGEGGGFHSAGIPTIGFLPSPQYLCAMAPDGEISKLDPAIFYDQLKLSVRVLLAMQIASAAELKGLSPPPPAPQQKRHRARR